MAIIAQGQVRAVCTQHFFTKTQATNGESHQRLRIVFKITESATQGDVGRIIAWDGAWAKGGGTMFTGKALIALGWDGSIDVLQAKLSKAVYITINHRTYKDRQSGEEKTVSEVGYINAIDGGPGSYQVDKNKLDGADAASASREFAELFAAMSAAEGLHIGTGGDAGGGNNSAPPTQAIKPPDPGSEIPF